MIGWSLLNGVSAQTFCLKLIMLHTKLGQNGSMSKKV